MTTMTDPVDTDALRAKARAVGRKYRSPLAAEIECDTLAAADEVDRLRTALTDADDRLALGVLVNLDGEQFVDHPVMQMLAERNERLHAVIENAPHHWKCRWDGVNVNDVCTCWKADAL